jgi:hypothetical protein
MEEDDDDDIGDLDMESPTSNGDGSGVNQYFGGSIFDDDMVVKFNDKDGKPRWRCKWCAYDFAGWNATKAIAHVNKLRKANIKPCKVRIDAEHASRYSAMLIETERKRGRSLLSNSAIDRSISSHNNITAATLETRRSVGSSTISSKRSRISIDSNDNDSHDNITPSKYFTKRCNFY